ncbi:MAG: AI-2E family transporter [Candidatus Bruticola sp.]
MSEKNCQLTLPLKLEEPISDETTQTAKVSLEDCQRIQAFCLLILTSLTCAAAAYWLKSVLLPFVFSVFLALTLRPIVSYLTDKFHCPRILSIILTLFIGAFLLVSLTIVVSNSVVDLTSNLDIYEQRFISLIDNLCSNPWMRRMNLKSANILSTIGSEAANSIGNALATVFNALFSFVSNIVLVGIYLIFLMFGSSMGSEKDNQTTLFQDICKSIEYYVLIKGVLSLTVGCLTWLILTIFNVPMAHVLGILAFTLNFIPNVGPIVAVILPLPLVLLDPDVSLFSFSMVVILPTIVHLVSGHLIEPRVIGDSLELDPIVILLTLMLAGVLWGPVGMLLATPMTVVCKMIIDRIGWAKPLASLLSGRKPHKLCSQENMPSKKCDSDKNQAEAAPIQPPVNSNSVNIKMEENIVS